jgi:hypothetical protein
MRPLLPAALALALAAPPALAAEPPAAVKRAADRHAEDVAGIVAFEAAMEMDLDAPLMKRASAWRAWVIARDGEGVETKVLSLTTDGKPGPAAERAKLETQLNASARKDRDAAKLPFERRHLGDYAFTPAPCGACEPGAEAFAFRAKVRDQAHGDGVLVVGKDGRMRKVAFTPAVMPPRVSTAEVVVEGTPNAAVGWGVTRFRARYAGGLGPLRGSMTMEQKQSGHRRFASIEAARAAAPR